MQVYLYLILSATWNDLLPQNCGGHFYCCIKLTSKRHVTELLHYKGRGLLLKIHLIIKKGKLSKQYWNTLCGVHFASKDVAKKICHVGSTNIIGHNVLFVITGRGKGKSISYLRGGSQQSVFTPLVEFFFVFLPVLCQSVCLSLIHPPIHTHDQSLTHTSVTCRYLQAMCWPRRVRSYLYPPRVTHAGTSHLLNPPRTAAAGRQGVAATRCRHPKVAPTKPWALMRCEENGWQLRLLGERGGEWWEGVESSGRVVSPFCLWRVSVGSRRARCGPMFLKADPFSGSERTVGGVVWLLPLSVESLELHQLTADSGTGISRVISVELLYQLCYKRDPFICIPTYCRPSSKRHTHTIMFCTRLWSRNVELGRKANI